MRLNTNPHLKARGGNPAREKESQEQAETPRLIQLFYKTVISESWETSQLIKCLPLQI